MTQRSNHNLIVWLLAILAVLLMTIPLSRAESTYHTPVSTGDVSRHVGADLFDASGIEWYAPGEKWLLLLQTQFRIFGGDGAYIGATDAFSCSGTAGDHEGVTTVSSASDVLIVQSENGGGICIIDADNVIDLGSVGTPEDFNWPTTDADCNNDWPQDGGSEGVAFVPDASLTGTCRYDGFLLAEDQGAGHIYKYCISPTNSTLDCISQWEKPACNGDTETPALTYDYDNMLLYVETDNGDATCVVDPFNFAGGYVQTILDPNTGGARTNTFEGLSFGNGYFAYADDGTGGTDDAYNGLWLFEDDFCGDNIQVSTEECDGTDGVGEGQLCQSDCTLTNLSIPIFTSYWDTNATLVGSGIALFNVTVFNTNGSVFLSINNTNYSATNLTYYTYNVSVQLTAGTYSYYWGAWGNDTTHSYNVSPARNYTVHATNPHAPAYSTFDGRTTDFNATTNIGAVQDAILEISDYGMINFSGRTINFSDLNLDEYVDITNWSIRVSMAGAGMVRLNESAILTFYNVTGTVPVVNRSSSVCDVPSCNGRSYNSVSRKLLMNITSFDTNFTVGEWDNLFACSYLPRIAMGYVNTSDYADGLFTGTRDNDNDAPLWEASGIQRSIKNPGVFWTHNDNWNDGRLFAINRSGDYLGTWNINGGRSAQDVEDIALIYNETIDDWFIYFGNIGDNDNVYDQKWYWQVQEPIVSATERQNPFANTSIASTTVYIQFNYTQHAVPHNDTEAFAVDPPTKDLWWATKRTSPNQIWRKTFPRTGTVTFEYISDLPFNSQGAVAMDISRDGRLMAIDRDIAGIIHIWQRPPGTDWEDVNFLAPVCNISWAEDQGEAVTFEDNYGSFWTVSEDPAPESATALWYSPRDIGCGNNVLEDGEECDGWELGDQTCILQGFENGNLSCAADCLSYNTSSCEGSVDTTAPHVNITTNATWIEYGIGNIRISWNASDAVSIGTVRFNITTPAGDTLATRSASTGIINLSYSNLSTTGVYRISLWANDTSNNPNSTTATFSVNDTTAPKWSANRTNITAPKQNRQVEFNITITDYSANMYVYSYDDGSGSFTNESAAYTTDQQVQVVRAISGNPGSVYRYLWYMNDTHSHWNMTPMRSFTIEDGTAPSVTLQQPANGSIHTRRNITFIFNVTDDYDTTLDCNLSVDDTVQGMAHGIYNRNITNVTDISEGLHTFTINCTDSGGNSNSIQDYQFTIDLTSPHAPNLTNVSALVGGTINLSWGIVADASIYMIYRNTTTFTLPNAYIFHANTTRTWFEDNTTLHNTTYHYRVVSVDAAGNYNLSNASNIRNATAIDATRPGIPQRVNASKSGNTVTINWAHALHDVEGNPDFTGLTYQLWYGTSINRSKEYINQTLTFLKNQSYESGNSSTWSIPSSCGSSCTYYFVVTTADDADNFNLSFTNQSIAVGHLSYTSSPPGDSPGGGGSSGGSSSGYVPPSIATATPSPSPQRERTHLTPGKPIVVIVTRADTLEFVVENDVHTLTVNALDSNKAQITIASTPQQMTLSKQESKSLPLSGSIITVTLLEIMNDAAHFRIESVKQPTEEQPKTIETPSTTPTPAPSQTPISETRPYTSIVGVVSVILVLTIIGFWAFMRQKRPKRAS